ncbi:hydroxyproline-rich glycoprotein family protein [Raphanus sativus]|uniref:Uncharacterized protein LOC108846309 n=1 Tax=Raphanus sativus TaxID=3726 RepID=A0A6J0MRG6_RAPSA|nr:uncharacterized protein LOC108846309 [Raphanus sativus]KAJ4908031.1 hydroxyproline-rich glycoprotein family protein [Raphanus sativus]
MTTTTDSNGDKTQTQTHKKQVRRRLQTSRPYQERLLNMAEARREIVTALKQHRASMRQAAKIPPPHVPFSVLPPPPPPLDPFSWSSSHLNSLLPNQPLGLNLNFHDFDDYFQTSSSSSSTSSNSSSSSSSVIYPTTNPQIYSTHSPPLHTFAATSESVSHEQPKQLMERENKVVTSAWWSELMMKSVEDDVFPKLSDVMEFPSWLNTTDEQELFHPYNLTHYSSPHNHPLSCMEFGDIEGIDGDDWLA